MMLRIRIIQRYTRGRFISTPALWGAYFSYRAVRAMAQNMVHSHSKHNFFPIAVPVWTQLFQRGGWQSPQRTRSQKFQFKSAPGNRNFKLA